ncbi:MAG: hypothetical protein ACKOAP_08060 [Vulcanococcus sp.]
MQNASGAMVDQQAPDTSFAHISRMQRQCPLPADGEAQLGWRFFAELDADSLRSWRAQDLEQWRSRLSPQQWQRRFGIGDDQPYASVEQLLACTDWNDLITTVIPGLRP